MANNLTVTYKGSTIHTASASGSATLETGGTWCEGDIGLSYTFDVAKATLAVAVTNGTATSVTATKSGTSVSLTYSGGVWSAELPSFGTWTVTITDGTHSNSATVSATQAGLYSVSIFMPDVPSAYTQLEYLQSSGTQYINTGVNLSNGGLLKVKGAFTALETSGQHAICGSQNSGSPWGACYLRYGVYSNGTRKSIEFAIVGSNVTNILNAETNHDYEGILEYIADTQTAIAKLEGYQSFITATQTPSTFSVFLFAMNNAGTAGTFSKSKIYYFLLYDNSNTPQRIMYPARRNSDSVLGMYDTVNNVFYTNSGTGTFTAGPAV